MTEEDSGTTFEWAEQHGEDSAVGRDGRGRHPPSGRMKDDSPYVPKGSGRGEMPRRYVDVVVGGQAGSEGKGAIVAHLLRTQDYGAAVRPGSSNAGHTVYDKDGDDYVHQVIPSAATVTDDVQCYMAPESSFGLDEFFEEYQDMVDRWGAKNAKDRVTVDPKAAIITDEHRHTEADRKLGEDIGSTVHGCGAVRVEKIWRSSGDVRLAEDYEVLESLLPDGNRDTIQSLLKEAIGLNDDSPTRVPEALREHGRNGERVMIEGTQGTLLSMNQSEHWPYSTSRDCTASAFLSSCGLPASSVGHTWAVFRTYPIRVGGNSGPLDGEEIDFETIADRAGHTEPPVEFTSVTKKKRRIFEWSWEQFELSLRLNDPDRVALTFLDYLDAENYGARTWWDLTEETREWVREVHNRAQNYNGSRVAVLKTGPKAEHTIDLRTHAPSTSPEWWTAGSIPPVDPDDAEHLGTSSPDDNWFDTHPTPECNYQRRPGAAGESVAEAAAGDIEDALDEADVDAEEIVEEIEQKGAESEDREVEADGGSVAISGAMLGVPGITVSKAVKLKKAGIESKADLRDASQNDLASVKGIGNALAARIKAAVNRQ